MGVDGWAVVFGLVPVGRPLQPAGPEGRAAMSTSLTILREQGPMTLHVLTGATAMRMQQTMLYADVDAVMRVHLDEGVVSCEGPPDDYRETVWTAVGGREGEPSDG
jgi:hypothetical protein